MELDMPSAINTLIGTVLGGLISALINYRFHVKSGAELRCQVNELRKLNKLNIQILADVGLVDPSTLTTDANGKLTGGIKKTFSAGITEIAYDTSSPEN